MTLNNIQLVAIVFFIFSFTKNVFADGLSDLQQTLTKLNGEHPVSGILKMSFTETSGEGKNKKLKTGRIKSTLSENSEGLEISYSKAVLKKIAQENRIKMADDEADTPTLNGAGKLSASSLIPILSSAQTILDYLEKGEFLGESYQEYFEKKVRVLDFALPLESFIDNKKIRSYVSQFKGNYQVLIDDEGVPVETRMSYSGKGSAYVFFSMKAEGEIISQYKKDGTRLVRVNRIQKSTSSSTFSDRSYSGTWQLVVQ